jgi:photosystem II stability/assembly factor-like uncharacterized protein
MFRTSPSSKKSLAIAALGLGLAIPALSQSIDQSLISGLKWRNIGPFRGGRVSAVTGALGQPGVFYIGLPLGGVWKTTSAGQTWYPVFDSVKEVSSIGSIQVAPSDPNIIYAGTGDMITGGGINEGNGVYKSTDAGKTWQHMGLDDTKQIPSILVDPHDPKLVLLAAQGNIHAQTDQRGVFRSTDGGATWKKTLFIDNETGLQNISWAYDHPEVILATTVRHYNAPGATGFGGGGGFGGGRQQTGPTGTRLYKSTDEGITWKEITGSGLPRLAGRTTTAIAMNTNAQRMFLVGTFGLYRSDDGGTSWHQMDASDRRIANGQGNYTSGVYVNSQNPDVVYTLATSSYRSMDGGKTFTGFKGAPGGDDPQILWVDPTDGKRLLLGGDQGVVATLDGGATWGSWYNQPTAQVYHISTDTQYPYWVYATQQDSGSIATSSRGNLGAITPLDWLPHPGYEFGSIVADPLNPKVSYAGGPGGGIVKVTYPSGQWINVSPNIDSGESLRKVGNQPIAWNPNNPHELLVGFQYLMSSTDGGMHWKKLSPDLGYAKGQEPKPVQAGATKVPVAATKAPAAKPAAAGGGGRQNESMDDDADEHVVFDKDSDIEDEEQRGAGGPGSIESFSTSTVSPGTFWVGTNNGLINVTKDNGRTWDDVTIPHLPNPTRADISAIDTSHQDAATAYVAIDTHGTGDYGPTFYRTHDYGKTWTKIVNGLPTDQPSGSFSRVIRADTKKAGLLFAGTESSVYVSFNDGDVWQPLMLNLPNTSYRDMTIHDNDLVVGTYGRGLWVLDDYSPLRQMAPEIASETAHLFKPGDAIRVRRNVNGDTPFPPEVPHALNPPLGAIIYYSLSAKPQSVVTLEISDAIGTVVRHMSSAPFAPSTEPPAAVPDFWIEQVKPMPAEVGVNRINWNIRYDNPPAFSHDISSVMGAAPGDTPAGPEGPLVLPGTYTAKLTVDGKSYTQTFTVKNDPRSPARFSDLQAQSDLQRKALDGIKEAWDGYRQVRALRNSVADITDSNPPTEVANAATDFDAKLAAVGGTNGGGRRFGGGGFPGAGGPPPAPTFTRVHGNLVRLLDVLDFGDMAPNEPITKTFKAAMADLKTVNTNWQTANTKDLAAFNAILVKNHLQPIQAAPAK